jgi:hypothetical protein
MFETDRLLRRIIEWEEKIFNLLNKPASLQILWNGGVVNMSTNSVSLNLDSTASVTGTPVELNSDGSVFAFVPANIGWQMQTTGIANMVVDPTTGIATFTPVAVGTTLVAVNDSATGLTGQGQITVTQSGPTPASLSIQWSTPTP